MFSVYLDHVKSGEINSLKDLLSKCPKDATIQDENNSSLLHYSAINNRSTITHLLLDYQANINTTNDYGDTPLHWAVRKKLYYMVSLLLSRGADLNIKNHNGYDPLHVACQTGRFNSVFLLLYYGANPNSVDKNGDTCIMWLIKNKNKKYDLFSPVYILLRFGASVTISDLEYGNNALHTAILNDEFDLRTALLIHNTDLNVIKSENASGLTPYKVNIIPPLNIKEYKIKF